MDERVNGDRSNLVHIALRVESPEGHSVSVEVSRQCDYEAVCAALLKVAAGKPGFVKAVLDLREGGDDD